LPHVRLLGGRERRIDLAGQYIEGERRGHVTALVGIYRTLATKSPSLTLMAAVILGLSLWESPSPGVGCQALGRLN
jgi:hypothetical protein